MPPTEQGFKGDPNFSAGEHLEAPESDSGLTRRDMLKAGIGAFAGLFSERGAEAAKKTKVKETKKKPKTQELKPEITGNEREYQTGPLEGRKFGGMLSLVTGIYGEASSKAKVDFTRQMAIMWREKIKSSGHSPRVVQLGRKIIQEYTSVQLSPERSNVMGLLRDIDKVISNVQSSIDWIRVGQIRNVAEVEDGSRERRMKLIKNLSLSVKSEHMGAYLLTELMPTKEGELNVNILEYLLKNAGKKYLQGIPALFDKNYKGNSFGPYQFTEFSVFDHPEADTHDKLRGASVINRALKKDRLPDDVATLRGDDHHKAAYLLLIYNITRLVKSLKTGQFLTLEKVWKGRESDLVQFAATAHHGDKEALLGARRWLDNGAKMDFWRSCNPAYTIYGMKTKINLTALKGQKQSQNRPRR